MQSLLHQTSAKEAAGAPELDVEAVAVPVQGPDADGVLGNVSHLIRQWKTLTAWNGDWASAIPCISLHLAASSCLLGSEHVQLTNSRHVHRFPREDSAWQCQRASQAYPLLPVSAAACSRPTSPPLTAPALQGPQPAHIGQCTTDAAAASSPHSGCPQGCCGACAPRSVASAIGRVIQSGRIQEG